ncbi:MAG TPA: general secretion pathway protein GspB [Aromatoleum sp.]|uniref:general secretion pathway protein GspB n=1 Tax=Aromatoleum sp. TaxID=2307007 RepID=UPI002B4796B0|nr:general secretion pathway protein GspB [Aromatoleum sp.]HJV28587.1 general secretion pathway protein GspB [Aromatoleum sp.]
MSYILEALQKSEHARQRGKVPDLSTIPATTAATRPERSVHHQPYVLAGFAVTLLAAVLGWWRPWQPATHPHSLPPEEAAQARQQTPQEAREEQKIAAAVPRAHEPAPTQARPTEQIQERPSAPPSDAPSSTTSTESAERIEKKPARARTAASSPSRPAPVAMAPLAPRGPMEASGSPQSSPAPTPARPTPGRILNLQDLPPAVRNSLPRLTVSGYASAGDSGKRMVVVNDRLVQEGEEVGPGVTVVTVGGDGVVFDYQGYRFRAQ